MNKKDRRFHVIHKIVWHCAKVFYNYMENDPSCDRFQYSSVKTLCDLVGLIWQNVDLKYGSLGVSIRFPSENTDINESELLTGFNSCIDGMLYFFNNGKVEFFDTSKEFFDSMPELTAGIKELNWQDRNFLLRFYHIMEFVILSP